ncbi:hypothetical protein ABZ567_31685 [Streptomyces sp. NPDC016459]|uniref:hypothetical protein n=1 Tax=Streptomyces sp. NPDC016459 TaxID=3157190 RepID=UPI0033EB0DE7
MSGVGTDLPLESGLTDKATAVDPYIDRQVLAQQTARQEEQRRALASFVRGWGAAGGTSS